MSGIPDHFDEDGDVGYIPFIRDTDNPVEGPEESKETPEEKIPDVWNCGPKKKPKKKNKKQKPIPKIWKKVLVGDKNEKEI